MGSLTKCIQTCPTALISGRLESILANPVSPCITAKWECCLATWFSLARWSGEMVCCPWIEQASRGGPSRSSLVCGSLQHLCTKLGHPHRWLEIYLAWAGTKWSWLSILGTGRASPACLGRSAWYTRWQTAAHQQWWRPARWTWPAFPPPPVPKTVPGHSSYSVSICWINEWICCHFYKI